MYCYGIHKQVLPIGAVVDLHHLSGTSELFSQILAPFFHVPFISCFSSQLLSTRVGSLHFSCTCPIFLSAQSDDSVANFLGHLSWIAFPLGDGFNNLLCYHLRVMYNCTTIKPTGVLNLYYKVRPSTTLYDKACTKTALTAQSTSQYYFVLQSLHKLRPSTTCTTKLAQSTSQYYFVLQSLHKLRPSTTLYYKACTKYLPVLLCTTKLTQSTSQYYFGLQVLHKVRPVLLCTTKLAQTTSQ